MCLLIWLVLIFILYDNTSRKFGVFLSSVSRCSELSNLRGLWDPSHLYSVGNKCG